MTFCEKYGKILSNQVRQAPFKKMTAKEILVQFCEETRVYPPFTRKKIEKEGGHNLTEFLLELRKRLAKADDIKTCKAKRTIDAFFNACDDLM